MNWTNVYAYTVTANTSGYYTGVVSGNTTSYNAYGDTVAMTSMTGSLFTLYSIAAAAAWCYNLQLTVVGYNSNTIIANNTFTLQIYTVAYLIFSGYSGLDKVTFTTSGGIILNKYLNDLFSANIQNLNGLFCHKIKL
jgi:hypothetical protein